MYIERLKKYSTAGHDAPTKPTEAPFVGSVGSTLGGFEKFTPSHAGLAPSGNTPYKTFKMEGGETGRVSPLPFKAETGKLFCRMCNRFQVDPLEVAALLDPEIDVPGLDNGSITPANLRGFIESLLARKAVYPIFNQVEGYYV